MCLCARRAWWGFDSPSDFLYANYINPRKCLSLCIKLIGVAITKACLWAGGKLNISGEFFPWNWWDNVITENEYISTFLFKSQRLENNNLDTPGAVWLLCVKGSEHACVWMGNAENIPVLWACPPLTLKTTVNPPLTQGSHWRCLLFHTKQSYGNMLFME